MRKKFLLLLIPSFLLILFLFTALILHRETPFEEYCSSLFTEEVKGDTLSLHYTLASPKDFHIDEAPTLPLYSRSNALSDYASSKDQLDKLLSFSTKELSADEQFTFTLLKRFFDQKLRGQDYFYLQSVFSPSGGTQIQFPILMAEYPFRSKEDIEDYLELLALTPSYFSALSDFEKEKTHKGFGMPDYTLKKVISQCNSLITRESLEKNEHFLISTFSERLQNAVSDKIITTKEASSYTSKNRQYLATYFLPAYENLSITLSGLCGKGKNEEGLSHFAQGKEYYKWLFYSITGSDADIENVYKKLAKDYYQSMQDLKKDLLLFQENNALNSEEFSYFPLSSSQDMLSDLRERMKSDFPSSEHDGITSLSADIKTVSPALEPYTAPAYYLLPPLDDNTQNSIYINESSVPDGLQLYTTLAHEGYPGHLYQTTFFQNYRKEQDIPYVRGILNYGGYVEGWALYTELLSYDYAAGLLVEDTGKEDYQLLFDIYKKERKASLCLLTLLDIGIHYYGMDYPRTCELLAMHGITDESTTREIFEYIVEEPCNYPKYYWGYQEILSLKETAQKQMGEYYSDYAFHQFFLESGPSDFTTLREKLTEE